MEANSELYKEHMNNNNNIENQNNNYLVDNEEIKKLQNKIGSLSGMVLALKYELYQDRRKLESHFRVITDKIYEMQQNINFLQTYFELSSEEEKDLEDDGQWHKLQPVSQ
ncbi:MAG: hypothetical protein RCG15_00530 [Candidatus Rickettsia vulgarisii]